MIVRETVDDSAADQVFNWPTDLNTVTAEQLVLIDGMGETIASRILAYRDAHGGFRSVDDLLQVKGIGEKRLDVWKRYFYVG
ncbi:MAG: helix-hairpin-helix domain-containing protein [Clostridia bacterium]|nr:helix-hairpin-helix domain-containing protein [Clostridia bacterium]